MQAWAWLQHEPPRQVSQAGIPVLNGRVQAEALEPVPVPEPVTVLVPVAVLVPVDVPVPVPDPWDSHVAAQSFSKQVTKAMNAASLSQLCEGLDDERQSLHVASSAQATAWLQHDPSRHVSHAGMPVLNGREQAPPVEPLWDALAVVVPVAVVDAVPEPLPDPGGALHAVVQSSSAQETKPVKAASLSQLGEGLDEERHALHVGSSAQACAWLQHEAPRQASHAAMPVLNGSVHAGPEPLPLPGWLSPLLPTPDPLPGGVEPPLLPGSEPAVLPWPELPGPELFVGPDPWLLPGPEPSLPPGPEPSLPPGPDATLLPCPEPRLPGATELEPRLKGKLVLARPLLPRPGPTRETPASATPLLDDSPPRSGDDTEPPHPEASATTTTLAKTL